MFVIWPKIPPKIENDIIIFLLKTDNRYVCHRIIAGSRAISVKILSDARKNRRYKLKTKTKTYL